MGETDEIPVLEPFNENIHKMKFKKQYGKSMLKYIADMNYQILLKN